MTPDAFLRAYDDMDAALVAVGFPPTSPWWRQQIERFARSGCRRWTIRAGRRAGKSTTLCRVAVCWALTGTWHVPPGDVGIVAFVSVSRDESASRLRTIAAILRALRVEHEQRGDEVEVIRPRSLVFRTFACTTTAVVGFTSIAVFGDEVSRWEARDTAANPAREVLGSLVPTLATQPEGFAVLCSSPWSTDDYHAELFDAGDTAHQVVSFAPTWVANPTISEEQTRALEPDERTWSREYAAQPGATVSAAIDPHDVAACVASYRGDLRRGFVAIDASSLRSDSFTWIAGGDDEGGRIVVRDVGGWDGEELRRVSMHDVVASVAEQARTWGASVVFGDQREAASLESMFADEGVSFVSYAWSEPSKDEAMQWLRRTMRERMIVLPEHDRLRRELTGMKAALAPSGRVRYQTNGLDYASALVTLAHAVVAGDFLPGGGIDFDDLQRRLYGPRPGEDGALGLNEPPLPRDRHRGTRFGGRGGRGF